MHGLARILDYGKKKLPSTWKGLLKSKLTQLVSEGTEHLAAANRERYVELAQLADVLKHHLGIVLPPPLPLQLRVVGGISPDFIESGWRGFKTISESIRRAGGDLADCKRILDFGCGCGRLLRAFHVELPGAELSGTDIDGEAIRWLQENASQFGSFAVNPHKPPMPFADASFDLVYGVSVFTHLPEDMQFAWLRELRRVVRPGGLIFLTFHGEAYHRHLHPSELDILTRNGFYYRSCETSTTAGLPAFYQVTWHSLDYIKREWGKYFEISLIEPDRFDHHDVVVMRRGA
jgi:SAM-dependent methyltransferase